MGTPTTKATARRRGNRLHLGRAATLAAAAALLATAQSHPAFATISTWRGVTGNWTGNNWNNNDLFGGYPNNGNGGHNFDVILNSGTATLDIPITVNTLAFGGGIIAGTNTLTITQGGSWTGGKIAGGVNVVVQNGLQLDGGIKRLRGNLTLSGDSNWTSGDLEVSLYYVGDDELGHSLLTNNGTLRINTDSDIAGVGATEALVVNNGLMIKESEGGVTDIMAGFNNNGTVTASAGTIRFRDAGTHTGRFTGTGTLVFERSHTFAPTSSVAASTVTFDFSGPSVVNTPNFAATTLNISDSIVNFNASPTLATVNLTQFGKLGGTGSVIIPTLTWSSGTMSDAGNTILSGPATFNSSGDKFLRSARQLQNLATTAWTGGNFVNDANTVFDNAAGARLDVQVDAAYNGGTFKNSGLVVKNAGTGVTSFNTAFLNAGIVRTDTGTLSFDGGGTQTGQFTNGGPATVLRFGGGAHTFSPGSVVNHPHVVFSGGSADLNGTFVTSAGQQVDVSGAIVNVNAGGAMSPGVLNVSLGTLTLADGANHQPATLNLSGGNIQGADNLNVATALNWSGGAIFGSGQVTAPALAISGDAQKTLGGTRQFTNNSAAATWQGNGSIQAGDNSLFTNPLPARLNLMSDADYLGGTFANLGQFTKSGGTGTSSFTGTFNNSGTVNVLSGTLSLEGAGNQTGTFNGTAAGSATLRLAGNHTFTANSHLLGPNVGVAGGTSDVVGQYALPASRTTTVSGGTLKLHNGPLPQFGNALNISGGTLDLQTPGSNADFTSTTLNLSSGLYQGTSSATFGTINFSGGTFQGSGTVRAQTLLAITADTTKAILGNRQLVNLGAASYWDGPGEFDNAATAVFTNSNTFEIRNAATYSGGTFNNFGTMTKTSAGVTTLAPNAFVNTGTLTVTAGELRIQSPGTHSGTLDGKGLLRLAAGAHSFTDSSTFGVQNLIIESSAVRSQGLWRPQNTTVSSGTLAINGVQPYTANSTLTVNGGTADLNTDAGDPAARRLAVSVADATVNFNATQHLRSLAANAGAHVNVADGLTPGARRIVTETLSVAPVGAFIDLRKNALIVDYATGGPSPLSDVRARVFSGYDSAASTHWNGPGINSSAASKGGFALGYAEASTALGSAGGNFLGEDVDGSAVLVRYTLNGDATLDGAVDFNDLVALAQHYNRSGGQLWSGGDFDYDGDVNFNDLVLLAQNYNQTLPAAAVAALPSGFAGEFGLALADVPEPQGVAAMLLVIAPRLLRRRRRRHAVVLCRSGSEDQGPSDSRGAAHSACRYRPSRRDKR